MGDLGDRGLRDIHYVIDPDISRWSDGRYATLHVYVWVDTDGNGYDDHIPDAGEPVVRFDTIVANLNWRPTP